MMKKSLIAVTLAGLSFSACGAVIVTPGSVAGYVYLPEEKSLNSQNVTISGVQLCSVVIKGKTEIYVGETPPKADVTVDYLIAGGGAGAGGGKYKGSGLTSPTMPGGDGEIKRGTFVIPAGSTDTIYTVTGGGGTAGSGAYVVTIVQGGGYNSCDTSLGGGGGGGAGYYGGGSGQLGSQYWPDMLCHNTESTGSGGGGGGSSAILMGNDLVAFAAGGNATDDPVTGVRGGKGGGDSGRGSGYCTYSIDSRSQSPACGQSSGWGSANHNGGNFGSGGSSSVAGFNTYNRKPRLTYCQGSNFSAFSGLPGNNGSHGATSTDTYCSGPAGGLGVSAYGDGSDTSQIGKGGKEANKGGNAGIVVLKYYNDFCFPYTEVE